MAGWGQALAWALAWALVLALAWALVLALVLALALALAWALALARLGVLAQVRHVAARQGVRSPGLAEVAKAAPPWRQVEAPLQFRPESQMFWVASLLVG